MQLRSIRKTSKGLPVGHTAIMRNFAGPCLAASDMWIVQKLDTTEGCKQAEINLIKHLHVRREVFGIKSNDKWIWPYQG